MSEKLGILEIARRRLILVIFAEAASLLLLHLFAAEHATSLCKAYEGNTAALREVLSAKTLSRKSCALLSTVYLALPEPCSFFFWASLVWKLRHHDWRIDYVLSSSALKVSRFQNVEAGSGQPDID